MNLPNKLTIARMVLTVFFLFLLFAHGMAAKIFALITFLTASLTDFLDGFIAKKNNQVTDFGKLMDPVADKILVLSAFLAFVELKLIPAWMVIIIILREVTITGLRALALTKGKVIPADDGGKNKTVSQLAAIFAILLFLVFRDGGSSAFAFWNVQAEALYRNVILAVMFITVLLTIISGTAYMVKNKEVYRNAKEN